MKRSTPFVLGLAAAALGLAGCTASPPQRNAAAPAAQPVRLTSLAAGDSLGSLVFSGGVSLGPSIDGARPIYAEVPTR